VLSGAFLWILLDPLLATKPSSRGFSVTTEPEPGTLPSKEAVPSTSFGGFGVGADADAKTRAFLWFLATSVTACGRVEGNRHWVSDTMGGAALGVVILSAALLAVDAVETRKKAARKEEEPST
jgi:hypothetical protein